VKLTPLQFLVFGFILVVFGVVMPYLMVLKVVEATFFLSFLSYIASFTGLMFGIIGIATYTRERRKR
jgi:hypothetical protein